MRTTKTVLGCAVLAMTVATPARPQDARDPLLAREQAEKEKEKEKARTLSEEARDRARVAVRVAMDATRARGRDERTYQRALERLDAREWEQALLALEDVIATQERRVDAALYWKAYALNKLGRRSEGLAALETLKKAHAESRWLSEAKALEAEVKQASGQAPSPESETDEDLKLMAINALLNTDAERAVPMLEKVLQGTGSRKLKERALFVLAQSGSPMAREITGKIARGPSNPDLQTKAIRNLGLFGGQDSREMLADIYRQSNDVDVKKEILKSFMVAGARDRVFAAAKSEKSPELRIEAIQQLGVMGAQTELAALYQTESAIEVKKKILHAMLVGGAADRLSELAKGEKEPELRKAAIHSLGVMGSKRTGDTLLALYDAERERDIKKEIIQGLFVQNNAAGLVAIARKESDIQMKKEIVSKLSVMRNKEATDYLVEILNK